MMKQLYTLIGLLTGFAGTASAQQFTLQNTVINGGSQIAHGGPFSVAATSGTPTTGQPSGGQFGVQGGESSGAVPFTIPIVPTMISTNRSLSQVTVGWQPMVPGYVLEFTDTLSAPRWFPYPGVTTNQISVANSTRRLYFRLRKADSSVAR
ncbi:MAG: hypothetical protein ISQ14_12420 [Verrucomicrobiae bacterium]|jgi:hypothetical protein|nr:hypothetical protein [Verrucomicrobiae bacterium]